MAIKTQVRLVQLTGSFGAASGKINDGGINPELENKAALADIAVQDLSGSLSYLATAIRRIHGGASFSNQAEGEFSTDLLPSGDDTYDLGSSTKAWQDLFLEGDISLTDAGTISSAAGAMTLTSAAAATWSTSAGVLTIDGAAGLTLDSDGTDAVNLGTEGVAKTITIGADESAKVDVNALIIELDSAGTIILDSTTTTVIGATTTMTVTGDTGATFGDDTGTLSFGGTGAVTTSGVTSLSLTPSSTVDIDSGGAMTLDPTGGFTVGGDGTVTTSAITSTGGDMTLTVNSAGGGEDLTIQQTGANDSSIILTAAGTGTDAVSVQATAGDMIIGTSLADQKTLQIGPTASTYLKLSPHDTITSEKVLLYNATGTADDAIKIFADAGGILVQADDDSLHLDANGTDSDALNIDSAGGIDVDAAAAVDILAGTTMTIKGAGASKYGDDTATWDFDGSGAASESGMTSLSVTPSGAITLTAGAASAWTTSAGDLDVLSAAELDLDGATVKLDSAGQMDITAAAMNLVSAGFDVNASGVVGIDSDGVMTLGAASMNVDADGGLIDIDATTTVTIGGSNATGVTIGRATKNVVIPGNLMVNGTATYINTSELMVEDKVVVIGIPGGMTDPGTATYALTSNVVTVTSVGHGLLANEFVLISDPAATVLITEGVYEIQSVADVDTFTFDYTRANVSAGTALDHSVNNVTDATATGSGIMIAPASETETSFKWDSSLGWLIAGPSAAAASLSPNVADTGALGGATREWSDLYLGDGSIINLGEGQDVTLTHVADTGILLNSTRQLQFNDSSQYIAASSAADLDLAATTDINLNCTTVDINAALDVSGASTLGGTTGVVVSAAGAVAVNNATDSTAVTNGSLQTDGGLGVTLDANFGNDVSLLSDLAVLNFGADKDVKLTHVADTGLLLNSTMAIQFNDASQYIKGSSNADLDIAATTDINMDCTTVDINGILDVSGVSTLAGAVTVNTGIVPDANDGAYLGTTALSFSDLFLADAGVINFNNGNSTLTGGSALINSNVALRALKLEVAGETNVLEILGSDLSVVAAADINLIATGDQIFIKGNAVNPATAWARGAANTQYLNFSTNDANAISIDSAGFGFRNSNGTMQFKDSGGAWTTFSGNEVTESKTVKEIPLAGVAAGARVFTAGSGFDVSQIPGDTNARVDCFINGQLMVSSSMVTGNGDYKLDVASGFADCDIQMQFALELDDIVSVIVR